MDKKNGTIDTESSGHDTIVARRVTKRTLEITGAAEATVSDNTRLGVAEDFLKRHEFSDAKNWCLGIIKEKPSLGRAYWLYYLADNGCVDEREFCDRDRIKSDFTYLEKAISATGDKSVRGKYYKYLEDRVRKHKDINSYSEYIELPESDDKVIAKLTSLLYNEAIEQKNSKMFDAIIGAINNTEDYIAMNLGFAHAYEELAGYDSVSKYYRNVLDADGGHHEAMYRVFEHNHKNTFEFCADPANQQAIIDELHPYGFNKFAAESLFALCMDNIEKNVDKASALFDNILSLIPKNNNEIFLDFSHDFIDKLFAMRMMKRAKKYNDLCLSVDAYDYEAYFNNLIIGKGYDNPLSVVALADNLMSEPDFFSAVNSFTEKHPGENNFYLDVNTELRKLKSLLGDKLDNAVKLIYVPCSSLPFCVYSVTRAMSDEAERLLSAACAAYGCSSPTGLYNLFEDVSGDERFKIALEYANVGSDSSLKNKISDIINRQGKSSRENRSKRTSRIAKKIAVTIPGVILILFAIVSLGSAVPFEVLGLTGMLPITVIPTVIMIIIAIVLCVRGPGHNSAMIMSGGLLYGMLMMLAFFSYYGVV